jgi:hypothetical protein
VEEEQRFRRAPCQLDASESPREAHIDWLGEPFDPFVAHIGVRQGEPFNDELQERRPRSAGFDEGHAEPWAGNRYGDTREPGTGSEIVASPVGLEDHGRRSKGILDVALPEPISIRRRHHAEGDRALADQHLERIQLTHLGFGKGQSQSSRHRDPTLMFHVKHPGVRINAGV